MVTGFHVLVAPLTRPTEAPYSMAPWQPCLVSFGTLQLPRLIAGVNTLRPRLATLSRLPCPDAVLPDPQLVTGDGDRSPWP